jgi:hypothetical protein
VVFPIVIKDASWIPNQGAGIKIEVSEISSKTLSWGCLTRERGFNLAKLGYKLLGNEEPRMQEPIAVEKGEVKDAKGEPKGNKGEAQEEVEREDDGLTLKIE